MSVCRCCGQPMPDVSAPFDVDLSNNMLRVAGEEVRVQPQAAEIAVVLLEKHPTPRTLDDMALRLYGRHVRPVEWQQNIRTRMASIRKALSPVGLGVEWVPGRGYRVVSL